MIRLPMNGVRRPKGPQYLSPARQGWVRKRAKNILFYFARFSQPWRAGLTYPAPLALSRVHWHDSPAPLAGAGLVTSAATILAALLVVARAPAAESFPVTIQV